MIADRQSHFFHQARVDASVIVSPLEFAVSWPIAMSDEIVSELSTHQMLLKSNTKLKADVLLLQSRMQKMLAIEAENQQLRALLQSSANAGGRVLAAQIVAIAPDPYMHQVVINKGAKNGVYQGQPVLDSAGVMGQVVQVGVLTSRVMLLTDSNSSIPVQDSRSGVRAIAVGNSDLNNLKLVNVTQTMDIKMGDLLITSGLGQRYPFGYPVGRVIAVKQEAGNQFLTINATPTAHLNRTRLVLLVWPVKVKIDQSIKKELFKKQKEV